MRVHVKFFAIFREMTGIQTESKEIAAGTSIEKLWNDYRAAHPRLGNLRAAFAINQRLAQPDQVLNDGDEVGFLPPVSGGAGKAKSAKQKAKSKKRTHTPTHSHTILPDAFITRKPLDLNALCKQVAFPGAGAIITFSGVVRDNARGKQVDHLEYEAYPEMAEQTMRDIIAEIKTRWSDARVAIAHRIGRLNVGDASLIIAVAAPHRPDAYAASRYAIERVKAILPVWKKEFATDADYWVEGPLAGEMPAEKAEAIVRKAEEDAGARR
ncbi:MAG: molybdenum cofactor biosynthesis protein MoaE [Chloroflexi bacterium]|nr:molybdenum cofactor biosynthesis protein MoaE [Chloroflexota bacterium]